MPSIYPALENESPECDAMNFSGRSLSENYDEIAAIALSPGIISIFDFIDARTMAEEAYDDELPDDLPPVMWHPPADGLKTIRALKKYIHETPSVVLDVEEVISDLNDLEAYLLIAEKNSTRFHLLVDI